MYQTPDIELWKGRVNPDPEDLLIHQIITCVDLTADSWKPVSDRHIALLGFSCDEGVRRNFGRVGARNSPDAIRRQLAGLSAPFKSESVGLLDVGNVICSGQGLEAASAMLERKVTEIVGMECTPFVLGGGHETAFPHFMALRRAHAGKRLGIINFDAHFDLRRYDNGPHSGSPFRNILDICHKEGTSFDYLPVGIRREANTTSLFELMHEYRQQYILLEEVQEEFEDVVAKIDGFMEDLDGIYVTVDLDCIPSAYAPGVSAVAPDGILPATLRTLVRGILAKRKTVGVDIVELNPVYDIDSRTAKLASSLIHHMLSWIY